MVTHLKSGQKTLETFSTTELFHPITPWVPSIRALTKITGYFTLLNKVGTFQYRLGVQRTDDMLSLGAPVSIGADATQLNTAGPGGAHRYVFDPTPTADGDVDSAMYFRIGILYSLSSAGAGSGTVKWQGLAVKD